MASEGPNSPGTATDDPTVGTLAWTNIGNILSSDNNYATAFAEERTIYTHYAKATNFSFAIPGGATINGIVVEIEEKRTLSPAVRDWAVKIVKSDGSIGAENKAKGVNWPTTEAYISYGANNDLWSEAWSAADINNANFGVVLQARLLTSLTTQANIDHIRITVYYTEVVVGTNMQVNISDVLKDVSEIKINISDVLKDVTEAKINIGGVLKDIF